ncbi:DUF1876 domain-containing protein [Jiangella rhizosphaerae]|uniref:DUF1876 domain-containing protein n=1 Tax=Jiangella rhizosphaerae TaxID=2293569 RepID=A0A418KI83_9ACTN|nr:DUF1876 domain-containing protein [Jiangella rhizosphaerae]RIQ12895.1 DUF1876 domain-containing protein [Jiangella rhizosphaerae]
MTQEKHWTIEVVIDEHQDDRMTHAEARLQAPRQPAMAGIGRARRNPEDPEVPRIGDELAVARALSDLAHQLLDVAAGDIEVARRGKP